MRRRWRAVWAGAPLVLGACGGAPPPAGEPAEAVERWVAAVRAGDAEAVWALLDAETRAQTSPAALAARLAEDRAELEEQAEGLARRVGPGGVPARARLPLRPGHDVVLEREGGPGGGWRVAGGVFDVPALATPADAVAGLRAALARRSLPGLLRVLARGLRADLEAEIVALLRETQDLDALEVEVGDGRAVVRTPSGRTIQLVREGDEWRVADVGEAPAP